MGVRLRTQIGYAVIDKDALALIKNSHKSRNSEHPDWDNYSTFLRDGDLDDILREKLKNQEALKSQCLEHGLDVSEVVLGLNGKIGIREPEGPCDFPAVKGCDQFAKKSSKPLMLFQDHYCVANSRYSDLIDGYLFNSLNGHTVIPLGAGIWPASGYRAKQTFGDFEKDKVYFWREVSGYARSKLEAAGSSVAKAEKANNITSVIGFSNEFHPVVADSIYFMLLCYFEAQGVAFDKAYWADKLYPCILFEWC